MPACGDIGSAADRKILDQFDLTPEKEEIAIVKAMPTDLLSDDAAKKKPKRKPLPAHRHREEQLFSPGVLPARQRPA